MATITWIIEGILIAGLILCLYFSYRNKKVYDFQIMLIRQAYAIEGVDFFNRMLMIDRFPAYSKTLFSFKPLRPIYWLSKEHYNIMFPETIID